MAERDARGGRRAERFLWTDEDITDVTPSPSGTGDADQAKIDEKETEEKE